MIMETYISRKVREIRYSDARMDTDTKSYPIENFRSVAAYVLLGPPGAGKSTTFNEEARNQSGTYVTARNFSTFTDKPEWHNTTLFIDGLDEIRAGQDDRQTSFDKIRNTLYGLGCPSFRLSCREADWFGAYDTDQLKDVSSDRSIRILRLEPLSDKDVCDILRINLRIPDPECFITEAQERGVQGLLTNPQSLEMLARAVNNGDGWPKTKTEAFTMACETLLKEHNNSHSSVTKNKFSMPDLMKASGRICAVQLLTGASGFSITNTEDGNNVVSLEQLSEHGSGVYLRCLQSKLFESMIDGQMTPVHRLIAEFLAAGYLANLVDKDGLPIARFLSLVTGHDGVVVSELRGLVAWLGAQSQIARSEIIHRDPIGTVLYGDARRFSFDEKYLLLKRLKIEVDSNCGPLPWDVLVSSLGELITSEIAGIVQKALEEPSREESAQSFAVILLKALNNATVLKGFNELLMQIVRDKTRWTSVRRRALEVLIRYRELDNGGFDEFITLVEDIHNGKVQDHEHDLTLYLLDVLYPNVIPESKIIEYLKIPVTWHNDFEHEYFWTVLLPRKSSPEQLAVILDQLVDRSNQLLENDNHQYSASFLYKFAGALLAEFLKRGHECQELNRLFDWLGLIMDEDCQDDHYCDQNISVIREWLEKHPEEWKFLLLRSIDLCADQTPDTEYGEFFACMYNEVRSRLFDKKPDEYGVWYLDQAIVARDWKISHWLLEEVAECLHYEWGNQELSNEIILGRLAGFPDKRDFFAKYLKKMQGHTESRDRKIPLKESQARTKYSDWHDDVKPFQDKFRENKASPILLHRLAIAYFGGYSGVRGSNSKERLRFILRNNNPLVEDVLTGFRKAIERKDLPAYKEILRLRVANRTHHLAYPIMAGLEEISSPEVLDKMLAKKRIIRLVLAIHYSVPVWSTKRNPADRSPFWFNRLLSAHPAIVADVLTEFVVGQHRNRKTASPLYDLANTKEYEEVARLVTMPILEKFPANCTSEQLSDLNYLFASASKFCNGQALLCLVERSLAKDRMSIAQRIHWLVAGLFFSPSDYAPRLESYVSGKERRIRFLAKAVSGRFELSQTIPDNQRVVVASLLIRLLGTSYRPVLLDNDSKGEDEGNFFTPEMFTSTRHQTSIYIEQMAKMPSSEATSSIQELLCNEKLRPWKSHLERAAYHQKEVRREDEFRYYSLQQVLDTLDKGDPANATDLAVLTYEKLMEIKRESRCANTSDWRLYWNVDSYNRPENPMPENACRNLLASKLRDKLKMHGIGVEKERSHVDDNRSDISVIYQGFNVPIEVKKSSSSDLWRAIETQLTPKYSIDPGSGGNGIYLVFWFGRTEQCRVKPPPSGKTPPTSARELEDRLKEMLPDDRMYNIHICVVDVSKPDEGVERAGGNA